MFFKIVYIEGVWILLRRVGISESPRCDCLVCIYPEKKHYIITKRRKPPKKTLQSTRKTLQRILQSTEKNYVMGLDRRVKNYYSRFRE